jgi:Tfp pilus assembly protein PilP
MRYMVRIRAQCTGVAMLVIGVACIISLTVGPRYARAQEKSGQPVKGQDSGYARKNDVTLKIETVRYTASGRRDPFVSIISLAREKMSVEKKSTNPLENFDVADFKLLGVIYDGKKYYASVVLPDQKAYTLKKGMKVGIHGGTIVDITSDKLVIREYVRDFMGKKEPKYTEIKLRTEEVQ